MGNRITLKSLALELGISVQAVSLALRGKRGISEETRKRVQELAERRGYHPDPGLRALADYRTRAQKVASRWDRVALVHQWNTEQGFQQDPFYRQILTGLRTAAEERGIRLEVHWLGQEGGRSTTTWRLLRNRGISGVFLAPPALTLNPKAIRIPHRHFQVVTLGPEHLYPDLHTVQFDFYENLRLAWRHLTGQGCRRIGLVYHQVQGWRTGHAWRAAFQVEQFLAGCPPHERPPLELTAGMGADRKDIYRAWFRDGNYDAVITSVGELEDWHDPAQSAPKIAMFNVNRAGQQGIDLNLSQLCRTAMELLVLEMQRSLIDEEGLPFRIHIPGKWVNAG